MNPIDLRYAARRRCLSRLSTLAFTVPAPPTVSVSLPPGRDRRPSRCNGALRTVSTCSNIRSATWILNKFKNLPGAPIKARSDLDFNLPDNLVNISDVTMALNAFGGFPYPFDGPPLVDPCP